MSRPTMQRLHTYMKKKELIPWGNTLHYLKAAALLPEQRGELIAQALQELLACLPAVGTALIWPCQNGNTPWKIYYAGTRQQEMQHWLAARLDFSLDVTLGVLQDDLSQLSDMPWSHLMCLQPAPMFPAALWVVWTPLLSPPQTVSNRLERVRLALEALIEVESSEEQFFSSASPLSDQTLIKALAQADSQALSAFLGLTRLTGKADTASWGRAYQDVIEATDHSGTRQNGPGFTVPRGQGVNGRITTHGSPIVVIEDYRTSRYRHPAVCDIADREDIRSLFALPIHSRPGQKKSRQIAGILYVTRRTVKPFSLAERLLVQRMTRLLEPLSPLTRPSSFLVPGLPSVADQKAIGYGAVLHANLEGR